MNISKNSAYVWILKYCLGLTEQSDYPKSFCSLMWLIILGVLLSPFLIPYIFLIKLCSKGLDKIFKNSENKFNFLFIASIICSLYASYFFLFVNGDDVTNIYLTLSICLSMLFGYTFLTFMLLGAIGLFIIEPLYSKFIKGSLENSFIYNVIKSYKNKTCKIVTYEK